MRLPQHRAPILTALVLAASFAAPSGDAQSVQTVQADPAPIGQPEYTLRTRVPITILDVVVTDAKGHPIHGLKQSDFTILEDKLPMTPKTFEEHRSDEAAAAPLAPPVKLPPNTFTNQPVTPGNLPIDILLIDSLNLPAIDQRLAVREMLTFVDKLAPGTRMAVFYLDTHLSILQGFTADRDLLKAALAGKKIIAMPSALEDPFRDLINISSNDSGEPNWMVVDREGEQSALRARYELTALGQIARYLSGVPGRKNLLWLGGSFPEQFPPFPDDEAFPPPPQSHFRQQSYDFKADVKSATDQLARAHVAVYPIDGHGLETMGPSVVAGASSAFSLANVNRMNLVEHGTMDDIAEQTGGKAFYNTNGLAQAAQQALDFGENFYTFTYTSANQALDTRFRTIKVTLTQPGLHLTYRPGYYAVDPGTTLVGAKTVPQATPLTTALLHGAIEPTQVLFSVQASSVEAPPEVHYDLKVHPKGSIVLYRRYTLVYNFAIDNIAFDLSSEGDYRAHLEFDVLAYDSDGRMVNSAEKEVWPHISPANYRTMLQAGGNAYQQLDVPAKGDFTLRLAIHDFASGHVGALEIPVSSIHGE